MIADAKKEVPWGSFSLQTQRLSLGLRKSQRILAVLSHSDSLRPMDCIPLGSAVHGDSPGENIGVGCHALLQGIFPTQGSNSGLLHCGWILYHLSHQGRTLKVLPSPFKDGKDKP